MAFASVLNIGSELTTGYRPNTHSTFLCGRLTALGHTVRRVLTLPDDASEILNGLRAALNDSSLIILTGGLGPTEDDITLDALSACLKKKLRIHAPTLAKVKKSLRAKGIPYLSRHGLQARVLESAGVWNNPAGFAPGQAIALRPKGWLLVFPGPPRELLALWETQAAPFLKKKYTMPEFLCATHCLIPDRPESWVAERLKSFNWQDPRCEIGVYSDPYGTRLTIRERIPKSKAAKRLQKSKTGEILTRFADEPVLLAPQTVPSKIREQLLLVKAKLATAESCTGGAVGRLLAAEPGISQCYLGGVIAYDNSLKTKVLRVSQSLLRRYGAVSEETARAMAEGILECAGADYSLAVTGIAGPSGGSRPKPVGLVYLAIAQKHKPTVVTRRVFVGARDAIQEKAAHTALTLLHRRLTVC